MSDNPGERPDETTASSAPQNDSSIPRPSEESAVVPPQPAPPQPAAHPATPYQPPRQPASPPPHPGAPAQPIGERFAPPQGAAPAGWPQPGPQYRGPYAGQPAQGYPAGPRPNYAGQPAHPGQPAPQNGAGNNGLSFGLPTGAQPTLTLPENDAQPRKKSGAGRVVGLIVAAALVGGAAGLGGTYAGLSLWGGSDAVPTASSPQTITVNDPDDATATTAIAAKVVPSVVTISASDGSTGGTGSGVILSDDGYVVTNTHVVTLDGATGNADITATTSDGRVFAAEIVGTDPTYDLAVIKLVDASGLTPIDFADSDDLNVGDTTVAVGAPLGLSNTVTTGIVSALNRSIAVASSAAPEGGESSEENRQGQEGPFYFDFGQGEGGGQATESINIAVIQTDAAINPGNSGGALVDDEGRLIGINVAIASAGSSSGGQSGSIGVGFAIPSSVAERVANEIIDTGSASHGLLGASVQAATSADTQAGIAGAYIAEVVAGGAAEQAGLREGDIVTAFDGKPITTSVDLTAQVRAQAAGAEVEITFVRDGQTQTVNATLGSLDS
jgi:putative serine protease PepD